MSASHDASPFSTLILISTCLRACLSTLACTVCIELQLIIPLCHRSVSTQSDARELMARGMEGKTMGANYEHEHSSRSHTVVRLMVSGNGRKPDASLLLVDLAGSEAAHDNSTPKAMS